MSTAVADETVVATLMPLIKVGFHRETIYNKIWRSSSEVLQDTEWEKRLFKNDSYQNY